MIKLRDAIIQRINELMNEKGKKPYDFYKEGGIPCSTISNLLNGQINNISSLLIYQVCSILKIKLNEFFTSPLFDEISD